MTIRSPMLLSLAALLLAACAMVLGEPSSSPSAGLGRPSAGEPFRCALLARAGGGGTVLEGRLDAARPVSGTYDLRVRASGAAIDQGGDFRAAAGQTLTLGEAQLGGVPAGSIDAALTLTTGGRTTRCPLERR